MNIFSYHPFIFNINIFWRPGSISVCGTVLVNSCLLVTDVNVCLAHGAERMMGQPGHVDARPSLQYLSRNL